MTKSELKKILWRANLLEREIKVVNMKIERLESCLQGHAIQYDAVHVQTSPKDSMADVIAEIEPLIKERDRLTVAFIRAADDQSRIIDMLQDSNLRLVMHYRYTAHLHFNAIADEMNYSEQRVFQLHESAMKWLMENVDSPKKKKH